MSAENLLEASIIQALTAKDASVATAESCSGGLVAHRLTNVPGSSACYLGGMVTYSNAAKRSLLGVNPETLLKFGAVSEPVAQQMAEGCRARLGASWGIGVTGIAGPGGGTAEKPVGLVFIAVSGPDGTDVTRNEFSGDRLTIKEETATKALTMLKERLG